MALDWPKLDELKQVLDVESDDWDGGIDDYGNGPTRLSRLLDAAILKVKLDVGDWDEYTDVPDESLSQAALRMAELMALKPEVIAGLRIGGKNSNLDTDPTYQRLLYGHRRRFGTA